MKLTRDERKRVFAGNSTALKRPDKPEVEPGHQIVLSWTRGGVRVVNRKTGETATDPKMPTVWIEVTDLQRKDGEWLVRYRIHDRRDQDRFLRPPPSGYSRAIGLKTRQRPREEAMKRERLDAFTPETERGYSGSSQGATDDVAGVPDRWLDYDRARREVDTANSAKQMLQRKRQQKLEAEADLRRAHRRGSRRAIHDLTDKVQRLNRDLDEAA